MILELKVPMYFKLKWKSIERENESINMFRHISLKKVMRKYYRSLSRDFIYSASREKLIACCYASTAQKVLTKFMIQKMQNGENF